MDNGAWAAALPERSAQVNPISPGYNNFNYIPFVDYEDPYLAGTPCSVVLYDLEEFSKFTTLEEWANLIDRVWTRFSAEHHNPSRPSKVRLIVDSHDCGILSSAMEEEVELPFTTNQRNLIFPISLDAELKKDTKFKGQIDLSKIERVPLASPHTKEETVVAVMEKIAKTSPHLTKEAIADKVHNLVKLSYSKRIALWISRNCTNTLDFSDRESGTGCGTNSDEDIIRWLSSTTPACWRICSSPFDRNS